MLRYTADIRTLAFVIMYFVMVTCSWLYCPDEWYLLVPLVILNCFWSFFCAVIVHNTIHCPMFRKKSWNKVMQVILSFTYGHPVSAFVPGHNFSHHRHTQSTKDNMRTTKMRFKWNFLNQALFFFRMSGDIIKNEFKFASSIRKEKPVWFRQYVFEFVLVIGAKIVLLILNWKLAILFILIPHQYAAWGIVGTNYWQHDGCDPEHEYNHSRTFTNRILNWFAFNNGYHGAHHDKPGLHWSLLPEFHEKNIVPHIHPNLNRNSLFMYCWETLIWPGKRLDYLGNPIVLPPDVEDEDWVGEIKAIAQKVSFGAES